LELVDRPNDLKFEMTARAVGRETVARYLNNGEFKSDEGRSVEGKDANRSWLRELTRWNYQKVVKFRGPEGKEEFERKAAEYAVCDRALCLLLEELLIAHLESTDFGTEGTRRTSTCYS
jgi:hypothetical protein